MGKINLDNYEAYFLDLMEGNLAEDDRRELAVFLNLHPELKAEMEEDFGEVTLAPAETTFEGKSNLKASEESFPISKKNIEDLMIAHIEKQLSDQHDAYVLQYIHDNQLDKTLAAYESTILKASQSETFLNKTAVRSEVISILCDEINTDNVEDYLIGSVEGTLTDAEQMAVSRYIEKNDLQKTLAAFGQTILIPDTAEVFQNKAALKKPTGIVIPLYASVASVAAIGLTLFGMVWNWSPNPDPVDGNSNKGTLVSEEENSGQLIDKMKPYYNGDSGTDYVDGFDSPSNNSIGIIPVDNQLVENKVEDPKIVPIQKDSVVPEIIIPENLKEPAYRQDRDDVEIVQGPDPKIEVADTIATEPVYEDDIVTTTVEREEPLKVFTNMASNLFKREVTFTRDRDTADDEYVAYGFKLGKFEFQRKRSRKL